MKTFRWRHRDTIPMTLKNLYKTTGIRVTDTASELTEVEFRIVDQQDAETALVYFTKTNGRIVCTSDYATWTLLPTDFENILPDRYYYASAAFTANTRSIPLNFAILFEQTAFDT